MRGFRKSAARPALSIVGIARRNSGHAARKSDRETWRGNCALAAEAHFAGSGKVKRMFKFLKRRPWPPAIDTQSLRETLSYMHDDLRRVTELMPAAEAIQVAIDELMKAELESGRAPTYEPVERQVRTFSQPMSPGARR